MGYAHERFARRDSPTYVLFEPIGITGGDLTIKANSTDDLPYIGMRGNDYISFRTPNTLRFYTGAVRGFTYAYVANVTTLQGGSVTGDDLIIKSNQIFPS